MWESYEHGFQDMSPYCTQTKPRILCPQVPPTTQPRWYSQKETKAGKPGSNLELSGLRLASHPSPLCPLAPSHMVRNFGCTPLDTLDHTHIYPPWPPTSLLQIAASSWPHLGSRDLCCSEEDRPRKTAHSGPRDRLLHSSREGLEAT